MTGLTPVPTTVINNQLIEGLNLIMATTITCDKCDAEIKPENVYPVQIRDQVYDLDINCAAEVQALIEGA